METVPYSRELSIISINLYLQVVESINLKIGIHLLQPKCFIRIRGKWVKPKSKVTEL